VARNSYKLKPERLRPKPKPKRKRKPEPRLEHCSNCGAAMVSPSLILEFKLTHTWKRLCARCSTGRAVPKPRMVMLQL